MFTCTGSEANDLALRIARTCTGGTGFIVTETAYHGVTVALAEMSPSLGLPLPKDSHVRLVPAPRSAGDDTGEIFARHVRQALDDMNRNGIRPAGLLVDTIFSSDGVFADPPGFLRPAVEAVRAAGGAVHRRRSAARLRSLRRRTCGALRAMTSCPTWSAWASRWATAIPSPAWRRGRSCSTEFGARSRYFNTFGGNPVSAAAGIAVLEVIEREGLIENARRTGAYLAEQLRRAAGAARADRRSPRRRTVHWRRAAAAAGRLPRKKLRGSSTCCASGAC